MASSLNKPLLTVWILVLVMTAAGVLVLNAIHPATTAAVTTSCRTVSFDTVLDPNAVDPTSLLATGLWVETVEISRWQQLLFRVPRSWADEAGEGTSDDGLVTVVPTSGNSRVVIGSDPGAFSIRDIFLDGRARVSWGAGEGSQRVAITQRPGLESPKTSVVFSTGDSLRVRLLDCAFVDHQGAILHRTSPGTPTEVSFPVSFAAREVRLVSDSGDVKLDAGVQPDALAAPLVLIRDLAVARLDCAETEYTQTGRSRENNTVLGGTVNQPEYGSEHELQPGDYVKATPPAGRLEKLVIGPGTVQATVVYQAQSLTVGAFENAQTQLVKSKLDMVRGDEKLILIYTVSLAVFGLISKFLITKKEA